VVIQALHDLRDGQLRRCLSMGFGQEELDMLKQPDLAALLIHAHVPWCKVTVDKQLVRRLAEQARDDQRETGLVDRLLRLGASSEMICRRHGLTHQEVALRRNILGLPRRKGRFPTLGEEQEAELWRAWQAAVAERGSVLADEDARLEWATERAESRGGSLAVIWAVVQNWVAQEATQETAQGDVQKDGQGAAGG
jgi:hypothetical protein